MGLSVLLVVPVQNVVFDEAETKVQNVAKDAEHDDAGPHVGDIEASLGIKDEVANAAWGTNHFGDDQNVGCVKFC